MYAGVKFISDNTVCVVPIECIKKFKPPVESNKIYKVFWSNNPDEKPNSSHKNVDREYKSLSNRKETSLPPTGYFNAKILCTADTLEETNEFLNSLGFPLQKRSLERLSKASTVKLISSASSSLVRANIYENSLTFTDDDDDDDDTDVDETVEPVRSYKEKLQHLESRNSKLEEENELLKSQLMLAKEQLKKAEEETKSISEKLIQTKGKYRNLKDEFKIARHLNYDLQRKLIGSISVAVSSNLSESNYEQSLSSTSVQEPSSPSLISGNTMSVPLSKRKQPTADVDESPQAKITKISDDDNLMLDDATENRINPTAEITEPSTVISKLEENNLFLSDEIIKSSSMGCRNGKDGDKVYAKNLAVNLFGKSVLMNCSATGRKPPTGGKPARPALPKAGIMYIRNLLEQRIVSELNMKKDLTEEEKKKIVDQRSSFVVVIQAIGDKIATLRRMNK